MYSTTFDKFLLRAMLRVYQAYPKREREGVVDKSRGEGGRVSFGLHSAFTYINKHHNFNHSLNYLKL